MIEGLDIRATLPAAAVQALVDAVADQVLAQVGERPAAGGANDAWLDSAAAAAYLGVKRKRIYDLRSMGALVPDGYDGHTPLYRRATLDRYASAGVSARA